MPAWFNILLVVVCASVLGACAQHDSVQQPQASKAQTKTVKTERNNKNKANKPAQPRPQKVSIRAPGAPENLPPEQTPTVEKNLFNLQLSPAKLAVNGVAVASFSALETLLAEHSKPVITVAAHRCTSAERVSKLMTIVKAHTETPIAYGAYGDYSDPECE